MYFRTHGVDFPPGACFTSGFQVAALCLTNTRENHARFLAYLEELGWFDGYVKQKANNIVENFAP